VPVHILALAARAALGVVLAVGLGLAAAQLAGAGLAFPVRVTSDSMAPYTWRGDYGIATYARAVRRGEVIVFRFPFGSPYLAIKRAVALAGDCVPGSKVGNPGPGGTPSAAAGPACAVVPPGTVYVVGDNAAGSVDSRHFGPVPAGEVVGKLVLTVPVTRWLARGHAGEGAG
jgi:signal peptidase I